MEAYAYFPCYVYRDEKPDWVADVLSGSQSHFVEIENQPSSAPVFQTANMIANSSLGFLQNYFYDVAVGILVSQGFRTDLYDFYVSGMWGQDIGCHGGHIPHYHSQSLLVGFFFLEVPEGGSYPIFHDPRPAKLATDLWYDPNDEVTYATQSVHFNNVKPGTFLFANSWLSHQIATSNSQNHTKFIHFTLSHKERGK